MAYICVTLFLVESVFYGRQPIKGINTPLEMVETLKEEGYGEGGSKRGTTNRSC